MKNKFFRLSMVVIMICLPLLNASAQIYINSEADLQKIGNDANYPLTGSYVLTTDLNMEGINWVPIGVTDKGTSWSVNNFTGNFDGAGHVIKNLTVVLKTGVVGTTTTASEGGGGLFYRLAGNTNIIKDLGLENVNVTNNNVYTGTGAFPIGGLAGSVGGVVVMNNVYVTGTLTSDYVEVGGLFGRGLNAPTYTIKDCYTNVVVKGKDQVGGLIGNLNGDHKLTIENCYAAGTVTATATATVAAGLVGAMKGANAQVTLKSSVVLTDQVSGTTTDPFCTSTTKIVFASTNYARSDVFSSYSDGTKLKSLADLKTKSVYEDLGWIFYEKLDDGNDNGGIWKIAEGNFPIFKWQTYPGEMTDEEAVAAAKTAIQNASYTVAQATANTEPDVQDWLVNQINILIASTGITVSAADIEVSNFAEASMGIDGSFDFTVKLSKGDATDNAGKSGTITGEPDPNGIPISEYKDFEKMRTNPTGKYYLTKDINLEGVSDWLPIGLYDAPDDDTTDHTVDVAFSGSLDGKGYAIQNLTYTYTGKGLTGGIFGRLLGTVRNLELRNLTITGNNSNSTNNSVGALAANLNNATVEQIAVVGCTLTGNNEVGGLVGRTINAGANIIRNIYVDPTTKIIGATKVGGLIGNISAAKNEKVENCYVAATIESTGGTGYGVIGGYAGTNVNNYSTTLTSVFVMAKAASGTTLDPFCLQLNTASTNYFACSKYFPSVDPAHAKSLLQLVQKANYSYSGWDFDTVWQMKDGKFPIFQWQTYPVDLSADKTSVDEAKDAVVNLGEYDVVYTEANTEKEVTDWLVSQINGLIEATGITVSASDIELGKFNAVNAPNGVRALKATSTDDGSFEFTALLTKGNAIDIVSGSGKILSTITSIDKTEKKSWSISGSDLNIQVTAFEPLFLSVYDVTGKALFAGQVNNQISIPANQGVYILKLKNAGKESVQKIIIK